MTKLRECTLVSLVSKPLADTGCRHPAITDLENAQTAAKTRAHGELVAHPAVTGQLLLRDVVGCPVLTTAVRARQPWCHVTGWIPAESPVVEGTAPNGSRWPRS